MRLSFHGGMCCGIKHIFELGLDPEALCVELKKIGYRTWDCSYDYASSEDRFFSDPAPVETKLQRLDRYLNFLKKHRPCGIVEITLVTPVDALVSQAKWVPLIIERGFKEVTPEGGVYNSNSGNRVRVFHLYMER